MVLVSELDFNSERLTNLDLAVKGSNRLIYIISGLIQSPKSCASVILDPNLSTISFHLSTIPKIKSKNDSG